jgi:hypothetical protein
MATTMRATTGINKVTIQVAGGGGPPYVLPPATNATLGGVIVPDGGGLAIDSGGNLTVTPYVLPPATNATLGGVIIPDGGNLAIDSGGNLTVTGGGGGDYVPIANLTGTGFSGKVFVGGVFGAPTANLVSGVIDDRGKKQFITSYRDGANITQIWVDKDVARIYGSPTGSPIDSAEISASRQGGIGLRTGNNQDATLFKQGTQLWSDDSILTRGYADTRYVPSVKSVVPLYANNGILYLNPNEINPDVQYICEMTAGMRLLRETILAPGRYTIRILNTLGSPLEIGTGISMPVGFDQDNDLGQNPGNITILEFIAYDDPPSYLFLTSSRVY